MNETSTKLEEKGPKFPSIRNGDQMMQVAKKEKRIVEVPLIEFIFGGSTLGTWRLRNSTNEVSTGSIVHTKKIQI